MSVIKQFDIDQFNQYDFGHVGVGDPVFFGHKYDLEDICGKVVHISKRREIVNVEFYKHHPLYNILKAMQPRLKLDLAHEVTNEYRPRLVRSFVIYMGRYEVEVS